MWITYSVLSCKLVTSFLIFSIFILSGKNGKWLWSSSNFPGYWISNLKKYLFSLIPPLTLFSITHNISIPVKRSNFTLVFFKTACYAKPGAVWKQAGLCSYISRQIFSKFSNTPANNNVSLWTNKSWYSPKFLFQNLYKFFHV